MRQSSPLEATMKSMATADAVLNAYPVRVRAMVRLLLAHAEKIGQAEIGSLELHFNGESVKLKLTQHLT